MKFDKLNSVIPYVMGGKPKILRYSPYNAITLRFPGRHAEQTTPVGGDFVVCVDDANMDWTEHQFSHDDIFLDLQKKRDENPDAAISLLDYYHFVITGAEPTVPEYSDHLNLYGVHPQTFLYAVQCLAIAEHRRYAKYENQFGGRFLPFRFAAGIVEGHWTATDAMAWQRKGRPGVEKLERENGTPVISCELMGLDGLTHSHPSDRVSP